MVERYTMIERLVAGETCPELHSERSTGFEPATLTLAKNRGLPFLPGQIQMSAAYWPFSAVND
jgi:hypothetical protein